MSSGRQHSTYNHSLIILLFGFIYVLPKEMNFLYPDLLGMLVGAVYMDPDNDHWLSEPIQNWGAFRFIWKRYADKAPHRGNDSNDWGMSHHWLLGTIFRVLYLLPIFIGLTVLRYAFWDNSWGRFEIDFLIHWKIGLQFIRGIWISDLLHIWADWNINRK